MKKHLTHFLALGLNCFGQGQLLRSFTKLRYDNIGNSTEKATTIIKRKIRRRKLRCREDKRSRNCRAWNFLAKVLAGGDQTTSGQK